MLLTLERADRRHAHALAALLAPSTDTGSRCAACRPRPSLDDVFLSLTERRPVAA